VVGVLVRAHAAAAFGHAPGLVRGGAGDAGDVAHPGQGFLRGQLDDGDDRRRLVEVLVHCSLPWTGDEGYKKAEVTGGGVSLAEIDPRTMESRRHPGLYLSGEVLDAFGPIGGYNFLWAWATGRAAGIAAASHQSGDSA